MMQSTSLSRLPPQASPQDNVPYSAEAMRQDLHRVRNAWADSQSMRNRGAIYIYLSAVFDLLTWWAAEGQEVDRAQQALKLHRLDPFDREDPFAVIIRCTADSRRADKRTRSKWSRVMRYAAEYKSDAEPLQAFIERKGGINKCAARFTRRLGRGAEEGARRGAARRRRA
jgi:hypothetical protein